MSGLEAGLLLGSVHSVVLAIALRRRVLNRRANQYLVALLVALALLLFDGFLRARGTLAAHPHLIGLTAWVPFVIGPLVFLYVREMTAPEPARLRPPWRHFIIPLAYIALLAVTFFPRSASYKRSIAAHEASWFVVALEAALLVYGIAYATAALVLLRRHREHVKELFSNLRGVSLRWLLVLALLNTMVWIAALVAFVIRMSGVVERGMASLIVPIGGTITAFVIGYFQLGQSEIFVPVKRDSVPPPSSPHEPVGEPATAEPTQSYARARLAEDDATALESRIRAAMTEKQLYRRGGLTLGELADEVAATPHEVSQVLSTRLGRNFYTFVNEHRIEHVKAELLRTDRPVLDIAFDAGFQSKSTFNSAFRKATGMTPSELRQRTTA
ncbi:MAG TPA: helix-turn-helix transcriptional regulator [Kofleriaceae bacterium]|nr:helix-turn-helix transcriptional regulator [Kofleriaceae bacterium]